MKWSQQLLLTVCYGSTERFFFHASRASACPSSRVWSLAQPRIKVSFPARTWEPGTLSLRFRRFRNRVSYSRLSFAWRQFFSDAEVPSRLRHIFVGFCCESLRLWGVTFNLCRIFAQPGCHLCKLFKPYICAAHDIPSEYLPS